MDTPSITDLIKQLRDDTTNLVREEIALAKAEISEKVAVTLRNLAYLMAGVIVASVALILALMGLAKLVAWILITQDVQIDVAEMLGYFITALLLGIVAAVLVIKAKNTFQNQPLRPDKTIQSLKEDKQWAKEKLH